MKEHEPYCLWFTGMPNSGKSTLTYELLQKRLRNCIVIDGDKFREKVSPELSFSREGILANNRTAIKVIRYLMGEGFNVLVAMITPFQETRDEAREKIKNYTEIFVDCPEGTRQQRPNFMASQIKYEIPVNPDVIVKTYLESIEQSTEKILDYLYGAEILNAIQSTSG